MDVEKLVDGKPGKRGGKSGGPRGRHLSRREVLRQMSWLAISAAAPNPFALADATAQPQQAQPAALPPPSTLTQQDDAFLNDLEQANFLFFWEQADPETGLIKDRCNVRTTDTTTVASIASSGFGLTAICIAHKRGFISSEQARERVVRSLSFLWHKVPTHRGFFFHFANMSTGERVWESEVSSIDTAILLCGVLTCRQRKTVYSRLMPSLGFLPVATGSRGSAATFR